MLTPQSPKGDVRLDVRLVAPSGVRGKGGYCKIIFNMTVVIFKIRDSRVGTY